MRLCRNGRQKSIGFVFLLSSRLLAGRKIWQFGVLAANLGICWQITREKLLTFPWWQIFMKANFQRWLKAMTISTFSGKWMVVGFYFKYTVHQWSDIKAFGRSPKSRLSDRDRDRDPDCHLKKDRRCLSLSGHDDRRSFWRSFYILIWSHIFQFYPI